MSDRQTAAVIILVILSLLFYLYNRGRLGQFVSSITGSTTANQNTISSTAAALSSDESGAQGAVQNVDYNMSGQNTGLFLNSIYGLNSNGANVIQYGSGSSSQDNSNNYAQLAEAYATFASI